MEHPLSKWVCMCVCVKAKLFYSTWRSQSGDQNKRLARRTKLELNWAQVERERARERERVLMCKWVSEWECVWLSEWACVCVSVCRERNGNGNEAQNQSWASTAALTLGKCVCVGVCVRLCAYVSICLSVCVCKSVPVLVLSESVAARRNKTEWVWNFLAICWG